MMEGWCPHKTGTLEEQECHFDGYCSECPHNKSDLSTARPEQQWIPCSERLPKKNGIFLVSSDDGLVTLLSYDKKEKIWFGIIPLGENEGIYNITDVIAWMPRPKPYKEERAK